LSADRCEEGRDERTSSGLIERTVLAPVHPTRAPRATSPAASTSLRKAPRPHRTHGERDVRVGSHRGVGEWRPRLRNRRRAHDSVWFTKAARVPLRPTRVPGAAVADDVTALPL